MSNNSQKGKTLVAYTVYVLAFTLILPLLPLKLLWRGRKAPQYKKRMLERLGVFKQQIPAGGIWIHAVSVGEVIAAIPTIQALIQQYPDKSITVTTTTPTGSECLLQALGGQVYHVYAPYDWPLFVWLFLRKVRPCMAIVVETELWPMAFCFCHAFSIPMLIANARLSAKSAAGYQKINWLVAGMINKVWVAAQNNEDAERFVAVGANKNRIDVLGSVKFDVAVSEALRDKARQLGKGFQADKKTFVWIAASTHKGEDEIILKAHKQLLENNSDVLLILVPRHPERFDQVAALIGQSELACKRRSSNASSKQTPHYDVLLVDTMGELMLFYGASDFAFVGGSLVPVGGHNYLEPACWAIPMVTGPSRHNFAQIAQVLESVSALEVVESSEQICTAVTKAMKHSEQRVLAGQAALAVINNNRGAGQRLLNLINQIMPK